MNDLAGMPDSLAEIPDSDLRKLWLNDRNEVLADLDDGQHDPSAGLDTDIATRWKATRTTTLDLLHVKEAKAHIQRMPEPGEEIEAVISGRYSLWSVIPATLELSDPATIRTLYITTLGLSQSNAADLLELLDTGKVHHVTLLCSHYFSKADSAIYEPLAAELAKRGQIIWAMRNHSKMLLMDMTDGTKYRVHSSANLRSSRNIEVMTIANSPELYRFHSEWIDRLITGGITTDRLH